MQLVQHELGQRPAAGLVGPPLLEGQQVVLHHTEWRRLLRLPPDVGRAGGLGLDAGRCLHIQDLSANRGWLLPTSPPQACRRRCVGTLSIGAGKNSVGEIFQRHSANLELQYFPLNWWRLHLGAFGHGGQQIARDEFGSRTGPAWGGGAILELALTTRLALTGRMDYTTAHTAPDGGWASTSVFSAGVAIY